MTVGVGGDVEYGFSAPDDAAHARAFAADDLHPVEPSPVAPIALTALNTLFNTLFDTGETLVEHLVKTGADIRTVSEFSVRVCRIVRKGGQILERLAPGKGRSERATPVSFIFKNSKPRKCSE